MMARRLSGGCEDPVALGFAGGRLFVVEREGRVLAIPLGGGEPDTIAEVCAPAAAASDGAALWLAEYTEEGALLRVDAGGARSVVEGLSFPAALAVAAPFNAPGSGSASPPGAPHPVVLIACVGEDRDGGGLCAVPLAGGAPRWIARGLEGPAGVAAEGETAWLLEATGRLLEVSLGGGVRAVAPAEPEQASATPEGSAAILGAGPYQLVAPSASVRPVVAAEGVVAWIGWDGLLRRLAGGAVTVAAGPPCDPPELLAHAAGALYAARGGAIVRAPVRAGELAPFVPDARPRALAASPAAIGWVDADGDVWTLPVT